MMEVGRARSLGDFNIEGVPWRVDAIVGFCIFRPLLKKVADRKIFDLCLGRHADVEEIFRRRQHIRLYGCGGNTNSIPGGPPVPSHEGIRWFPIGGVNEYYWIF